jgi:hypothetical protein
MASQSVRVRVSPVCHDQDFYLAEGSSSDGFDSAIFEDHKEDTKFYTKFGRSSFIRIFA